jgi:hypothetical protein
MMQSMNSQIKAYREQLQKGTIQKAYRGIMAFMSVLHRHLGKENPTYSVSSLYAGYMDMTYIAVTPPLLKDLKLKIAIVYLHEEGTFEAWLAAANRSIQAEYMERLQAKDTKNYTLASASPGVDAILSATIIAQPDFDHPAILLQLISDAAATFTKDMIHILCEGKITE